MLTHRPLHHKSLLPPTTMPSTPVSKSHVAPKPQTIVFCTSRAWPRSPYSSSNFLMFGSLYFAVQTMLLTLCSTAKSKKQGECQGALRGRRKHDSRHQRPRSYARRTGDFVFYRYLRGNGRVGCHFYLLSIFNSYSIVWLQVPSRHGSRFE